MSYLNASEGAGPDKKGRRASFSLIWIWYTIVLVSAGWLDDIGLPQYKDQFHESRVDGRMLQYLTVVS